MAQNLSSIIIEIKKAEEVNKKNRSKSRKTNPKLNRLIKYLKEIHKTIGDYDTLLFFIEPKGRNDASYEKEFALFLKESKKNSKYCPTFTYPEIENLEVKDINNVILKLNKIRKKVKKECTDNNITEIVFELLEVAEAKVNFLKELKLGNLEKAFEYSKIVYGDIENDLCLKVKEAYEKKIEFLKNGLKKSKLEKTLEKNKFNAQEIKKYFDLALTKTELKYSGYKVVISDNVSNIKIGDNSPKYDHPVVLIPRNREVNGVVLLQLIAHEIGRHATTNFYHKKQGFVGEIGRGWNIFNEGMAKKSEIEIKKIMLGSLCADSEINFSIYYVLAIEKIKDGWNFAKVYRYIFKLNYKEKLFKNRCHKFKNKSTKNNCKIKSKKEAIEITKKICLRVFRGFDPKKGYMYFPKDKVYFEGKMKISELEKVESNKKIDKYLHLSKVDPKFIPFLIKIGAYTYEKNWEKAKNIATQIWIDYKRVFINKKSI